VADQLLAADVTAWPVAPGWQSLVDTFFQEQTGRDLLRFLKQRLDAGATVFPPHPLRALELTEPESVRVVILGQDPYHRRGQAEGLAFSVAPGMKCPPSLRNIFKELQRDTGLPPPRFPVPGGSLLHWAKDGVLLLNTCLTVEEGQPASHANQGWESLTHRVVQAVASCQRPVVFMLWGAHAQQFASSANQFGSRHLVLMANHPSPLSALRPPHPFLGCGHFAKARTFLEQMGRGTLNW
jgi:uracil-DNA glycosylase